MEIESFGSSADYRHYLSDLAILTKTGDLNDPSPGITYIHRDRLGSIVNITDDTGLIEEGRGFDAFGKPRNGDWSDKVPPVIGSNITDRGFTEHEHLDEHQLIHMNGRGFDYNLGRFLSVDPIIQAPGNSQGLNPYSYIMNNPLSGTDPTGYLGVDEECQARPETCSAITAAESAPVFSPGGKNIGFSSRTIMSGNGMDIAQPGPLYNPERNRGTVVVEDLESKPTIDQSSTRQLGKPEPHDPSLGAQASSLALDLLPGVGSGKSIIQLIAGKDIVTGADAHRGLEFAGILLGLVPGAKALTKTEKISDVATALMRKATDAGPAVSGGFTSFSALKRALGPAGEGRQWHHIVEQSKVAQFGPQAIHNADNVVAIPTAVHRKISGFYSSKPDFTGGMTVRQWLNGQSLEKQKEFGRSVLQRFGVE